MKISRLLLTTVAITSTGFLYPALAQTLPESALSTAEPGRASQQLSQDFTSVGLTPDIKISEASVQNAPPNADKIKLKLNGLNIQGVSVYTTEELSPAYQNQLGQTVTLADIYVIAQRLKLKYRNDGYLLAQTVIPPQTIENGIVDIRVIEGTVDAITIQGDETKAANLIRKYADKLATGAPLNAAQLERQLLLMNDIPGVSARSVLRPSPNVTGATDIGIIVERDPFDAVVGINNYGSRYLGPLQLNGAVSFNNQMFGQNEQVTFQLATAPDSLNPFDYELGYFSFSFKQPLWSYGTTAEFFYSHTDTDPGYTLHQFDVNGLSNYVALRLEQPFIRTRAENLTARAILDWRTVKTTNNLPEPAREDNIRALRIGGRYNFLDTLMGAGLNSVDLELAHGLNWLGSSEANDPNLSRAAGDPQFFKVNAELQRMQRISSSVNLLLAASGQWSSDALLASEEFGIGGMGNIGRGYDPSEVVGDKGVAGKVEVQWSEPVTWNMVDDYEVFGFYDVGRVWNKDPTTAAQKRDTLSSTGLGLRTQFMDSINADFTVALPLNRDVETQGDKDPRFYFSLSKTF